MWAGSASTLPPFGTVLWPARNSASRRVARPADDLGHPERKPALAGDPDDDQIGSTPARHVRRKPERPQPRANDRCRPGEDLLAWRVAPDGHRLQHNLENTGGRSVSCRPG